MTSVISKTSLISAGNVHIDFNKESNCTNFKWPISNGVSLIKENLFFCRWEFFEIAMDKEFSDRDNGILRLTVNKIRVA